MSLLFQPYKLRSVELRNRIVISPMCQYSATDGLANNWHLVHLGSRATGGAGLIIQESTAVSPEGRITPHDLGLWNDAQMPKLQEIVSFIHAQGAVAGIQLGHAGRKASHQRPWDGGALLTPEEGGWPTVAPSSVPFKEGTLAPEELTEEGIQKVINDFRKATERALEIGYRVIEIHAAHGYLLHQFLSPLVNKRTDKYGGSFENRVWIVLEVTKAVREVMPENLPLFVRVSASDWADGGWNPDESAELAKLLRDLGVDLIDVSSGGAVGHQKISVGPGYQVPFSEKIRSEAHIPTGAVGLITDPFQAEQILQNEQADLILIARESLRDPYFPLRAATVLGDSIHWPSQYEKAKPKINVVK